jgi:hypothetical protein
MMRIVFAVCIAAVSTAAPAATCVWNTANGSWSTVANWTGCADAAGPSTRTPGEGDIAVLVDGTANLDVSPTVAEFELGSNGVLFGNGNTQTLEVIHALRFAGGHAKNLLGQNLLFLNLRAGGAGSVLAPTTLENSVFFENSGALALGSAGGTALTLLAACELRNMPGGTITMSGGDSRLYLGGSSKLVNNVGATLTINGNTLIDGPDASASYAIVSNLGAMIVNGPGTLNMPLGNLGSLEQHGDLAVNNATIVCDTLAAEGCRFLLASNPSGASVTRLNNATLMLGGSGFDLFLDESATLAGTGTVDAGVLVRGTIAPGAAGGAPYGTLAFTGNLAMNPAGAIKLDLGSGGNYDRLQIAGTVTAGYESTWSGYGSLDLHLAAGYAPALGEALPVMTYAGFQAGSSFHRVSANYALDYAARFDPTALQVFPAPRITIDSPSLVEGAGGQAPMSYSVRLSQPTTQTVIVELLAHDGTAVYGVSPSGDWLFADESVLTFAPGEVLKTHVHPINGDTVVEADESFSVEILRNTVVNAAIGNGVPGDPLGIGTILTDELAPDTRFVLVGKDNGTTDRKIRRYTTTGTFIDTWDDRMSNAMGYIVTGMCFSPSGEVLATRFAWNRPILYSHHGARLNEEFGEPVFMSTHESCVYDSAGNVYIGIAGASGSSDADVPVRKFNRYGDLLDTFVLPTGPRGTDWIDLAGDQCTLYYTSEDTIVRRYNVCTRTALPDFSDVLTPPYCYAIRLRPNREVMVACQEAVHRLSPDGDNLHTYTRQSLGETDPQGLFALNLDPDGTSFWTAGAVSGDVYHVDIATGAVLGSFDSGPGGAAGLAIYDELHHEVIFADGFDPPSLGVKSIAKSQPQPGCRREFRPEAGKMPHYVPRWMKVVIVGDEEECEG